MNWLLTWKDKGVKMVKKTLNVEQYIKELILTLIIPEQTKLSKYWTCVSDWRRCVQFIRLIQSLSLKCMANSLAPVLIQRCETVVILLSAVTSWVNNLSSVINYCNWLKMMKKTLLGCMVILFCPWWLKKTSVRCMDCNTEVSDKVQSAHGREETVFFSFFDKLNVKPGLISQSTSIMVRVFLDAGYCVFYSQKLAWDPQKIIMCVLWDSQ